MSRLRVILQSLNPERVHNFRVIALSILAAATFWFLNALNDSYSTTVNYPVEFVFDTERYIATEELPDEIQINVNGLGWNLFRNNLGIKTAPIIFRLENAADIKKLPANTMLSTVSDQMAEFQVNFVLTDTVYLKIDNKVNRLYQLVVDSSSIQLDDNYWLNTPISFSPDTVLLTGPESLLDEISDSLIVRIPQKNIDENYNEDIPIEVRNNSLINRDPPTINVSFGVEEFVSSSLTVPITAVDFPEDSSVFLDRTDIVIGYQVGKDQSDNVPIEEFELQADFKSFNSSDSTVTLKLISSPSIIKNIAIDSTGVKVLFNEEE